MGEFVCCLVLNWLWLGRWTPFFGMRIAYLWYIAIWKRFFERGFCAICLKESDRVASRIGFMSDLSFPFLLPFFPYNLSLITSRLQFPAHCYYSMLLCLSPFPTLSHSVWPARDHAEWRESLLKQHSRLSTLSRQADSVREHAESRESRHFSALCLSLPPGVNSG